MIKTYTKPELKVIAVSDSADIIQTSGEAPLATLNGVDETLVSYGATDFDIFKQ